jgi:hypothetical protein
MLFSRVFSRVAFGTGTQSTPEAPKQRAAPTQAKPPSTRATQQYSSQASQSTTQTTQHHRQPRPALPTTTPSPRPFDPPSTHALAPGTAVFIIQIQARLIAVGFARVSCRAWLVHLNLSCAPRTVWRLESREDCKDYELVRQPVNET